MTAIRALDARAIAARIEPLIDLMRDSVEAGASVGFMLPYSAQQARTFWSSVADAVAGDRATLFGAFIGERLIGCVLLARETMPNQKHRGDIRKLLVHTAERRRGIGRQLMDAAVAEAKALRLELLVLDTATEAAEKLYDQTGWTRVGIVPNFARNPDGSRGDTVYYYLELE